MLQTSPAERLVEVVDRYPDRDEPLFFGSMNATPKPDDMRTLLADTYINDEVIRAVLGIAQLRIDRPWTTRISDPKIYSRLEGEKQDQDIRLTDDEQVMI